MTFKKSDISYLKGLTKKTDRNRSEINKVIDLYESRKIARLDTAELIINKLQSRGKTKNDDALKRLATYEVKTPITGILKRTSQEAINTSVVDIKS